MACSKVTNACYGKLNAEFSNFMSGNEQEQDQQARSISFLVSGKTGVGKSHLVNAFLGKRLACESEMKTACTGPGDTSYKTVINDTEVLVWDSAGLQDDSDNDEFYLEDVKTKLHQGVDIMIYCIKMPDKRFHKDDKNAIRALARKFGPVLWENAVIALTFANLITDPEKKDDLAFFEEDLKKWKKVIREFFAEDPVLKLDSDIYEAIPIVPAGSYWDSNLLTGQHWFSELWIYCYSVMDDESRIKLFHMLRDRFEGVPGAANMRQMAEGSQSSESSPTTSGTASVADKDMRPPPDTCVRLDANQQKTFWDKTWDAFNRHCFKIGLTSLTLLGSGAVLLMAISK